MGPSISEISPSYKLPHALSPDQGTTCGLFVHQRRPGGLAAFFWRHFLALSEMLAQPIVGNVAAETFRRSLVRWQDRLFVFLVEPEASPTNNGSEQALRWSAVFRTVTNCFRSVWGAKLYADVHSVIETARRRGIGALEAILLTLRGQLLPVPA